MEQRDFFISYTKTDKAWAVWIADVLKRNGYSVYVQALDIRPGDDFLEKMEEFLENSRNFIAVWSKGYSKSRYCMNELRAAFHEWNAGRINCLLPVRVDDFPMKALYAALVHVELSDMGAASETELMKAVKSAVPLSIAELNSQHQEKAKYFFEEGIRYFYDYRDEDVNWESLGGYYEQSYYTAMSYFEDAAKEGSINALIYLGDMYQWGLGVKINYAKALEYYQKAADAGDKDAPAEVAKLRKKLNR